MFSVQETQRVIVELAGKMGKHPSEVLQREYREYSGESKRSCARFVPWKETLLEWFPEDESFEPEESPLDLLSVAARNKYNLPGVNWKGQTDKQKKQEFNESMGHVAQMLRDIAADPDKEMRDKRAARYIKFLTQDESTYLGKRLARSVSIGHAREMLFFKRFESFAREAFADKIVIKGGYAKKKSRAPVKRIVTLGLSDLHIGATLEPDEHPSPYDFLRASRRMAALTLQAADYKSQYRDNTVLNLLFNGDVIEGLLQHDQNDGAPLEEQCTAFTRFSADMIAYLAGAFPEVYIWFQPGNHGRNKLRHPGRATNQKWDSTETILYKFLEQLFEKTPNVHIDIRKPAVSVIPLFNKHMLMTHGDTELKLGSPSTQAFLYEQELDRINAKQTYGPHHIDLLFTGHYHDPKHMPFKNSEVITNGALVPSNGFARSSGHDGPTGQWIWESVEGHVVGDERFVRVGERDDEDSTLDQIVKPYAW